MKRLTFEMSVLNSIGSYDRLRELAEADKDGRLVVLPCKVGQRVFALLDTWTCCNQFPDWVTTDKTLEAKAISAWNRRADNG